MLKEGLLQFYEARGWGRWKERYFRLSPRALYYGRKKDADIFKEIDLVDCTITEAGNKNQSCSFKVNKIDELSELIFFQSLVLKEKIFFNFLR